MKTIEQLKAELKRIVSEQQAILNVVEDADREMTSTEEREYRMLEQKSMKIKSDIEFFELNNRMPPASGPIAHADAVEYRTSTRPQSRAVRETPELQEVEDRLLISGYKGLSSEEYRTHYEGRALQADLDVDGGFLLTQFTISRIIQIIDNMLSLRSRIKKFLIQKGESIGVPTLDADPADPTWTAEIKTGTEDDEMKFGKRQFFPHPLAKRIRISKRLLRVSSIDPAALVRERLAYTAATVLENAYINGNGINSPLGICEPSDIGVSTNRDRTTESTAHVSSDDLIDCVSDLKAQYRGGAIWLASREFERRVRKLKSGDGVHLLIPSIASGVPSTLLGYPLIVSEYFNSTWTSGQYVAALFDPKFYWAIDQMTMQVQVLTELYAETNQNGYIFRYEGDGAPIDENAFIRLKLK